MKISGASMYVSHGLIKLYVAEYILISPYPTRPAREVGHPVQPKNFKANIKSQLATRSGESTVVPNRPYQPAWIRFLAQSSLLDVLRPLHSHTLGVVLTTTVSVAST